MKSITFRGHDFAPYCTAETTLKPIAVVEPKTRTVPGRAGALLAGGSIPPVEIKVKLMLCGGRRMDAVELATVRHKLASWLGGIEGGVLTLPEEPELSYRDCVVTKVKAWDALFEDGSCEVTFTAHDPVAYGPLRRVTSSAFEVGGTWPTWPVLTVRTKPSNTFLVTLDGKRELRLTTSTRTGDIYVFDCAHNRLTVNGEPADDRVALGSDFLRLSPGFHSLSLRNCTLESVDFCERWL